jgi:hypothetical protein
MQGGWWGGIADSVAEGTKSLLGAFGIGDEDNKPPQASAPTQDPPKAGENNLLGGFVEGVKNKLQDRVSLVTKPATVVIEEITSEENDSKKLETSAKNLGIGLFNLVTGADELINLFEGADAKHSSEQPEKTTDQSSKSTTDSTPATIFTDVPSKLDPDELRHTPVPKSSLKEQKESQTSSHHQERQENSEPPLTAPRRSSQKTPSTSPPPVAGTPPPARPLTPRFTSPPPRPARPAEAPPAPDSPPPPPDYKKKGGPPLTLPKSSLEGAKDALGNPSVSAKLVMGDSEVRGKGSSLGVGPVFGRAQTLGVGFGNTTISETSNGKPPTPASATTPAQPPAPALPPHASPTPEPKPVAPPLSPYPVEPDPDPAPAPRPLEVLSSVPAVYNQEDPLTKILNFDTSQEPNPNKFINLVSSYLETNDLSSLNNYNWREIKRKSDLYIKSIESDSSEEQKKHLSSLQVISHLAESLENSSMTHQSTSRVNSITISTFLRQEGNLCDRSLKTLSSVELGYIIPPHLATKPMGRARKFGLNVDITKSGVKVNSIHQVANDQVKQFKQGDVITSITYKENGADKTVEISDLWKSYLGKDEDPVKKITMMIGELSERGEVKFTLTRQLDNDATEQKEISLKKINKTEIDFGRNTSPAGVISR